MIALLFVAWGFRTLRTAETNGVTSRSLMVFVGGVALALTTFLQPAVSTLIQGGATALSQYTPGSFWWWLFIPSYILMTGGLAMTLRSPPSTTPTS